MAIHNIRSPAPIVESPRDVVPAAVLGGAGGVVGIAIAVTVVAGVELLVPALPLTIVWSFVGVALAVSLLIGLLSGLLPATRAAGMDPVEALRTE